jgi:hypothetical protein
LQLLLEQTAKLRRDPDKVKAEIDAAENEEWIDKNMEAVFVFKNDSGEEESFRIDDFL